MANNIDIKDGNAAATKLKSTEAGGVHTVHHNVDASALPTGAATSALQVTAAQIDTALRATPLPVSGTFYQGTQPVSLAALPALVAGAAAIGTVGVTSVISGTAATNLGKARDAAAGATDTGTSMLLVRRDTPTAVTPVAGDYETPQLDSTGSQWVHVVLGATGGATPALVYSAASNNLTSLKASAGTVTSIAATNNHATNYAYLKLYNKASAPVVASDTPIAVYALGPGGGGIVITPPTGMAFSTGIAYAVVGGATHTDATNTAAAQVTGCITYH